MAIGALSALRAADVAVPDDIALVGFDDVSSTQYTIPPLSSVHGQVSDLGNRAVVRLAEAVAGREPPTSLQEVFPATLVVRRSCGCGSWTRDPVLGEQARATTEQIHSTT
jgi:LacI family transcriptional regulator